jgi:hypothetical protein
VFNVLAVASALRHKRSLDQATLWMWLAGFDVTNAVYRMLKRKAEGWRKAFERELREEEDAADSDDPSAGSDLLHRLVYRRAPKWATPFRRYFRGELRDQFHTTAYLVLKALGGGIGVKDWANRLEPDEVLPLRRALGALPRPTEKEAESEAWKEGISKELKLLEREFSPRALVGELEAIRELDEWCDWLDDLRDQFTLWIRGMTIQFGGPFVPVTPEGFLLWFAARFVSVRFSWIMNFLLTPMLSHEQRGDLLKFMRQIIHRDVLFPQLEEFDESARKLLMELQDS